MGSFQIIQFVNLIFEVLVWLIIIRCVLSFVPHNPTQPVLRFIYDVTDPVMRPFSRIIPPAAGIDFSPIIAVLAIELVRKLVIQLLMIIF